MLYFSIFSCLLVSVIARDFDEITYRRFYAVDEAVEVLREIVRNAKSMNETTNYDSIDGKFHDTCTKEEEPGVYKRFLGWKYLEGARIVYAQLNDIETQIFIEIRTDELWLSFELLKDEEELTWKIEEANNLACSGQAPFNHKTIRIRNRIVRAQNLYYDMENLNETAQNLTEMFKDDFVFKFCDGSKAQYFFQANRKTGSKNDTVIMHDKITFWRQGTYIGQVYATVNGRKMQLEYEYYSLVFTKGREYPCIGLENGLFVV